MNRVRLTRRVPVRVVAFIVAALAILTNARASNRYHLTDLGSFYGPGGASAARALNDFGQVTGSSDLPDGTNGGAFLWTPATPNGTTGTMTNLGAPIGSTITDGYGINNYGQVVGRTFYTDQYAFLFTPSSPNETSGTITLLDNMPAGVTFSYAYGLNDSGQVVGSVHYSKYSFQGYLWTPGAPHGTSGSVVTFDQFGPRAINASGQIVGGGTLNHATLWKPDTPNGTTGTSYDLGDFPDGQDSSYAEAVNSSGQVVGAGFPPSNFVGFRWDPTAPNGTSGQMTQIITALDGDASALGINDAGDAVGKIEGFRLNNGVGTNHAVLWTAADQMLDLNTLLDSSGLGWTVAEAWDINNSGQVAGVAWYDPDGAGGVAPVQRGFLLTPIPEPVSAQLVTALMACGFTTLRFRRRRHSKTVPLPAD
jgi:uncharacterized membrane protein